MSRRPTVWGLEPPLLLSLQLFLVSLALSKEWLGIFFPSFKPFLLVCVMPISYFCITREKADTLENEEWGSV